jgi:hypothetical protein
MVTIRTTSAHYVRCLKPNPQNEPGWIHRQTVVDQLRYGGVLEAVRVSRVGYVRPRPLDASTLLYSWRQIWLFKLRTRTPEVGYARCTAH